MYNDLFPYERLGEVFLGRQAGMGWKAIIFIQSCATPFLGRVSDVLALLEFAGSTQPGHTVCYDTTADMTPRRSSSLAMVQL